MLRSLWRWFRLHKRPGSLPKHGQYDRLHEPELWREVQPVLLDPEPVCRCSRQLRRGVANQVRWYVPIRRLIRFLLDWVLYIKTEQQGVCQKGIANFRRLLLTICCESFRPRYWQQDLERDNGGQISNAGCSWHKPTSRCHHRHWKIRRCRRLFPETLWSYAVQ